jgi:hypothetical protein
MCPRTSHVQTTAAQPHASFHDVVVAAAARVSSWSCDRQGNAGERVGVFLKVDVLWQITTIS